MIIDVYFKLEEFGDDGTVCFYATDGVITKLVGRFPPDKLPEIKSELLFNDISAADVMCDLNIKKWLTEELEKIITDWNVED